MGLVRTACLLAITLAFGILGVLGKTPAEFLSLSKKKLAVFESKFARAGSQIQPDWTRWYSRSVPTKKQREIEQRRLLWPPACNGYNPLEAECRDLESGKVWDPHGLVTVLEEQKLHSYPANASCTPDNGAICIGDTTANCPDIAIRFRCPDDFPSKENEFISSSTSIKPEFDWATDRLGSQYDENGRPGYPCETKKPKQCAEKNGKLVFDGSERSSSWRDDRPISADCWRYEFPRKCLEGHLSFIQNSLRDSWDEHRREMLPHDYFRNESKMRSSETLNHPFRPRDLSYIFSDIGKQDWPKDSLVRIVTLINEFDSNFGSVRYLLASLRAAGVMNHVTIDICYLKLNDDSLPDFVPPSAAKALEDIDLQNRVQSANMDILPGGKLPVCSSDLREVASARVNVVAGFGYHKDRKWMQTYGGRNPLLAVRELRAAGANKVVYLRLADEYCTTSCMPPNQVCVRTSRDRPAGLAGRCFGGFEPDDCEPVDAQFRVYYDHRFEGVKLPMPLGFGHIWPYQSKLSTPPGDRTLPLSERKYLFNFVGSLTNPVRQKIVQILKAVNQKISPEVPKGKIHLVGGWSGNYDKSHGYIAPHEYKEILEQSVLTISPAGHQWECHRWYEAIDAGSVLVMSLDEAKNTLSAQGCGDASILLRYMDIPAIFIRSWESDLGKVLLQIASDLEHSTGKMQWESIRTFVEEWNQQYMEVVGNGFMHSIRELL